MNDALSNGIFFIQYCPGFHGEITGIKWTSPTVAIRCYFRNNDGELIFFPNSDVPAKVMLK